MLAVVKTPHIDIRIQGDISPIMLRYLSREYGRKLQLKMEEGEMVDFFETPFAKRIAKKMTPGDYVKTYRQNLKLTQEALGKKLGVPKNYVSDWENNRRSIAKEKAKKLSALFRISAEHLI